MLKKLYQWIRKIVHVTKFTHFVRFLWSVLPVSWPIKPKRYTLINIFFIFLDAATEICHGWTWRQSRNEQTGRTIMQTNPEDKYEVKKFCFVWLAPGMKRGAT